MCGHGRRERLEHHQQREADRVGEEHLVVGIELVFTADDRIGDSDAHRLLAPRLTGAQHVEAYAGDDRRQPPAEVLDVGRVGAIEP